jgi:hypothetical protein
MAKKKSNKKDNKKKDGKKKILKLKLRKKKDNKKKESKKKDAKKKESKKKESKKKDTKKKDTKKKPKAKPAVVEIAEKKPLVPAAVQPKTPVIKHVDHSSNYNVTEAIKKLKSIKSTEELLAFTHGEKRITITKAIPAAKQRLAK